MKKILIILTFLFVSIFTYSESAFSYSKSVNIDFDIRLKLERVRDNLNIECFGKHNLFPYYELFTNHKTLYTFSPTADGTGIYNLNASTTFHFEKTLFL